ncbi:MAG: RNA polymerase sigma factor [Planctomycetota bacterium]
MEPHSASLTGTTVLEALSRFDDRTVWARFEARYRPLVFDVARRAGLGRADAADVAQETMLQVVRDYARGAYDRERGRLSQWVRGIARHRIGDVRRAQARRGAQRGESALGHVAGPDELDALFEAELRRRLLADALAALERRGELRPKTLEAFRLHVLEGVAPDEVARRLGCRASTVYWAKHRCVRRLQSIVDELGRDFEELRARP